MDPGQREGEGGRERAVYEVLSRPIKPCHTMRRWDGGGNVTPWYTANTM